MKKYLFPLILFFLTTSLSFGQIVTLEPSTANGDQEVKLIFDATQGDAGLVGASKVYVHTGVVTDSPTGTAWTFVKGNWGADDGIGLMTKVSGEDDKWEITLSPSAREYYGVPSGTNMFRLSMVFRNADGSSKGAGTPGSINGGEVTSNGDIYMDLNVANFVTITSPTNEDIFVVDGESVTLSAEASSDVTAMAISVDEGNGFDEKANVTSGNTISFDFTPTASFQGTLKVTATVNGESLEVTQPLNVTLTPATQELALPAGLEKGINYGDDLTKVSLVLEAPGKDFVYVVGDFNNWQVGSDYLMNVTPDGELFWIELSGLTANQEYVFQYLVDGNIRVGDPYADKVADPWNDSFIPASVHEAVPTYNNIEYGIATTFQTGQTPFAWGASEGAWQRPEKEDLVIYELLVRDFIGTHSYQDLVDTLDYIAGLGVNAIELMPIMEFEGNESWGYNPMYFFAPDKYYGSKDNLKTFIQACHQKGIAVILDMVLNHAFGLNPMVRMYWDEANSKPAANSPWFNPDATHPFNVGFDFNHESTYTQDFVDSVNAYWINEYHFDGYRFDLSKGFTQRNNPSDVGAWSAFDQSRIDLLTRMSTELWSVDQGAYVILEHFADGTEEAALAVAGMLLWRNVGFSYWSALGGSTGDTFQGATASTHVSYMESHDEQRQLWEVFQEGGATDGYNTRDTTIALERLKMNAAFIYTLPGPKMLWQFGELGYDIDINFNGRVGNKPLVWGAGNLGYYEDPLRGYTYDAFAAVIGLRNLINQESNISYVYDFSGDIRSISIDSDDLDVLIVGNFGLTATTTDITYTQTGEWYDYFSDGPVAVGDVNTSIDLAPGQFRIFTSNDVSDGFPGVVEAFVSPVTVNPEVFGPDDEITITFDATKANPDGTSGLVGASKVYMHAGVVFDDVNSQAIQNLVGSLTDDGVGLMTKVDGEDDMWQITITPTNYFSITSGEAVRLGMYFRDADNSNVGKGFRGSTVFLDMELEGELISVSPAEFDQDDQITLTYDARFGNRGLVGENKVYMHSGISFSENGTAFEDGFVIGNWGEDDGVGLMTRSSENANKWQITFTPTQYYGMSDTDVAYRLAMVFRNVDGSKKGAGTPGDFEGGTVIANGDIFFDFPIIKEVTSIEDELPGFNYYPNPTQGIINFSGDIPGIPRAIKIFDLNGNEVFNQKLSRGRVEPVDITGLKSGLYLLRILTDQKRYTLKVLVR
ncbi:DUF4961 domain-containing protein [Roseivirga sp. E12]|uniref:DUF4961 domain-containing protein n=1 Tax=Roseivirga sp. E12 TaxID=2819237 RepID=UPI001ABCB44E|nr:DUF4961 domain-containing protein [Roseivirga sp. E12]MBO3698504.1 T9SS type A sorting domain-containing protein [Roseivirga sp. E12]